MIHVVVALAAEARPLITHLQLEKVDRLEPLAIYRRADLALIVGGVGQEATVSGVEALAKALPAEEPSVWLNIGVAGHRDLAIGTVVLARRVVDAESGHETVLTPPADLRFDLGDVRTVRHVETKFATRELYEMEASAFCQRAMQLTTVDLVQVLKIVSDNRRTGTLCISARQVQALVEENLPAVDRLVASLYREARRLSR